MLLMLVVVSSLYVSSAAMTIKRMNDEIASARTNPQAVATFITNEYRAKTDFATDIHNAWRLRFNEDTPAVFDTAITYLNAKAS